MIFSVDDDGYVYSRTYEPPTKRRDLFDVLDEKYLNADNVLSFTSEYTRARFVLESLFGKGLGNEKRSAEELEQVWIEANGEDLMGWMDEEFVRSWLTSLSQEEWLEIDKELQTWLDEEPDFDECESESNYPVDGYAFAYEYLEGEGTSELGIELIDGFAPGHDGQVAKLVKSIDEVNAACERAGKDFRFEQEE